MAKQVTKQFKIMAPGGKATPAPPIGPALGANGVNPGQFIQQFNDRTKDLNGRVVGCVYLTSFYEGRPAYDQTAEISLYLDNTHQGRGLGSMLMQRMIAACPRLGVTTLIGMHFDHNEATRRLNQKFGFEEAGHLTEIAVVQGQRRGLLISLLRIPPSPT